MPLNAFKDMITGVPLESLILYCLAIFAILKGGKSSDAPSSLIQILSMLKRDKEVAQPVTLKSRKR